MHSDDSDGKNVVEETLLHGTVRSSMLARSPRATPRRERCPDVRKIAEKDPESVQNIVDKLWRLLKGNETLVDQLQRKNEELLLVINENDCEYQGQISKMKHKLEQAHMQLLMCSCGARQNEGNHISQSRPLQNEDDEIALLATQTTNEKEDQHASTASAKEIHTKGVRPEDKNAQEAYGEDEFFDDAASVDFYNYNNNTQKSYNSVAATQLSQHSHTTPRSANHSAIYTLGPATQEGIAIDRPLKDISNTSHAYNTPRKAWSSPLSQRNFDLRSSCLSDKSSPQSTDSINFHSWPGQNRSSSSSSSISTEVTKVQLKESFTSPNQKAVTRTGESFLCMRLNSNSTSNVIDLEAGDDGDAEQSPRSVGKETSNKTPCERHKRTCPPNTSDSSATAAYSAPRPHGKRPKVLAKIKNYELSSVSSAREDNPPLHQQDDLVGNDTFRYVDVVRKKAEREALPGHDCPRCAKFYAALEINDPHTLRELQNGCSRHRQQYQNPDTPEDFWKIPQLSECEDSPTQDSHTQA